MMRWAIAFSILLQCFSTYLIYVSREALIAALVLTNVELPKVTIWVVNYLNVYLLILILLFSAFLLVFLHKKLQDGDKKNSIIFFVHTISWFLNSIFLYSQVYPIIYLKY